MNIVNIARYAAKAVSVLAVQQVIDNIVVATTPEIVTATNKVMTRIGSAVLSAYIGDAIGTYITREWDDLFAKMQTNTVPVEEPVVFDAS